MASARRWPRSWFGIVVAVDVVAVVVDVVVAVGTSFRCRSH